MTVLAFLLALGVLITVHEWGHYRVAVACGVKVLRFEGEAETDVSVNFGGTYRFTPDCQLDAGIRVGLAGEVDDAQLFLGW